MGTLPQLILRHHYARGNVKIVNIQISESCCKIVSPSNIRSCIHKNLTSRATSTLSEQDQPKMDIQKCLGKAQEATLLHIGSKEC